MKHITIDSLKIKGILCLTLSLYLMPPTVALAEAEKQKPEAVVEAVEPETSPEISAGDGKEAKVSTVVGNSDESNSENSYLTFGGSASGKEASATDANVGELPESSMDKLLQVLTSFVMVVILIFVLAAAFKRFGGTRAFGGTLVTIKNVQAVGQKEKLMVVEAYGKTLLIGVTPTSINALCEFSQSEVAGRDLDDHVESSEFREDGYSPSGRNNLAGRIQDWYFEQKRAASGKDFKRMLDQEMSDARAKKHEKQSMSE